MSFGTEAVEAVVGQPGKKREEAGQPKSEPTFPGVRRNRSLRAKEPQRDLSELASIGPEIEKPVGACSDGRSIGNRPERGKKNQKQKERHREGDKM